MSKAIKEYSEGIYANESVAMICTEKIFEKSLAKLTKIDLD